MTTRRGFLGAILAAGVAPAFVGSSVLMPVRKVFVPEAVPVPSEPGTMVAGEHGLVKGDLFTIAGMTGTFVVTQVCDGGVINLHPASWATGFADLLPSLDIPRKRAVAFA